MSKQSVLKASVILVGLFFLAVTTSSIFAVDEPIRAKVGPAEVKKEKLASRAAALKTKLQTFKDKRKAETAERVNANLNAVNQNQTANMQRHLANLSTILDKLENRVNQGTPDIKDPASARGAIASAKEAITTASAAATDQSLKDYTIQITSEAKVKANAKVQRDKLHTDLQALRKTVIDARQFVGNAIKVAKSGSQQKEEATRSGQQ